MRSILLAAAALTLVACTGCSQTAPLPPRLAQAPHVVVAKAPPSAPALSPVLARLDKDCTLGSAASCFQLADGLLSEARNTPADRTHARSVLDRACGLRHPSSCAFAAVLRLADPEPDFDRIISDSRRACDGGSPFGCGLMGRFYVWGEHVPQDIARGFALTKGSCTAGSSPACENLGRFYEDGVGVDQDFARAVELFRASCDRAPGFACSRLGDYYANGVVVEQDWVRAAELYAKGCGANDGESCRGIGIAYARGQGVEKDPARAEAAFRKACDQKDGDGCAWLGLLLDGEIEDER